MQIHKLLFLMLQAKAYGAVLLAAEDWLRVAAVVLTSFPTQLNMFLLPVLQVEACNVVLISAIACECVAGSMSGSRN